MNDGVSKRAVTPLVDDEFGTSFPWDDESIGALDHHARETIGTFWHRRAQSELSVSAQFVAIRTGFAHLAPNVVLDTALASAIADEARHARLCSAVARRYAGERHATKDVAVEPLARFGDADERISLLLHLVLLSCVNEVSSTFYLRTAMKESSTKLATAVLRDLLSDDIEHARIGWSYLGSPSVDAEAKGHVSSALPTLLRLSYDVWQAESDHHERWFTEHGCPGRDVARASFELAVPEVILPGMALVGVAPGPGARWFSETVVARRV